jgi:hypothetical protein
MNKNQSKYWRMFLNTQETLNAHTEKWTGIPVIVGAKTEFDELIQRIFGANDRALSQSKAITAEKAAALETVVQKAETLSGKLQAYAAVTGNVELAIRVKITRSDIIREKETNVGMVVAPVIAAAQEELRNLADYGVTETEVPELESAVDGFMALVGTPRTVRNQAFAALSEIDQLVEDANDVVKNKLDTMMLQFKYTEPVFYDEYLRARAIVD